MRISRKKAPKQPIARKEKLILILTCLQLSLAIWAIALTHLWSQITFALLSIAGFVICLVPQQVDLRFQDMALTTSACWKRMKRFPLFWTGLVLMIYVLIQALNPAYGHEILTNHTWKAFPIDHIQWLPSSVASPFVELNAWRLLMILGAAWLFLCYTWTGLTRRRTIGFLMWFMFVSSIAFCALVITQKELGAKEIYWNWSVYPNFFGSVPYKNRGAAMLYLMMGSSMALYFHQVRRMREQMKHSGPHLIVLLGILIQYATLWTSFSRAGLAVGTTIMLVFLVLMVISSFREGDSPIIKFMGVPIFLLLVAASIYAIPKLPSFETTVDRFEKEQLTEEIVSLDFNGRGGATRATWAMIKYKPVFGWGAGSWRYVFPYYQDQFPELKRLKQGRREMFYHDAHCDWAQYVSDLGIVGAIPLLSFVFWPIIYLFGKIKRVRNTHLILACTILGLFSHCIIELLSQNLAVLSLMAVSILLFFKLPSNPIKSKKSERLH